jgi:hypothetical protein
MTTHPADTPRYDLVAPPDYPEPMLEWFAYGHLPSGPLRATSARFAELANTVVMTLPRSPERTVALRKLLEAKDAAVRCAVAAQKAERKAHPAVLVQTDPDDETKIVPVDLDAEDEPKRCGAPLHPGAQTHRISCDRAPNHDGLHEHYKTTTRWTGLPRAFDTP